MLGIGAACCIPKYLFIGWALNRWVAESTIFAFFVLFKWWLMIMLFWWLLSYNGYIIDLCDFVASNTLFNLRLFNRAFWSFGASPVLAYVNICSLVTKRVSLRKYSSCIAFTILPSSFNPLINCPLMYLSSSLYVHAAVLI